eukprot:8915695-Pyramimonas_sp.AAC.1
MDSGAMTAEVANRAGSMQADVRLIARVARRGALPSKFAAQIGEVFLASRLLFDAATRGPLSLWKTDGAISESPRQDTPCLA